MGKRHDSDSDMSPPRKDGPPAKVKQRHDSDDDLSPPRQGAARQRHDSDADLSPPGQGPAAKKRQRHDSDEDMSPPRKGRPEQDDTERMTSGLRAGLVRGEALKKEAATVREERRKAVEAAPEEETGKNAATVYRSRDLTTKISREQWAQDQ